MIRLKHALLPLVGLWLMATACDQKHQNRRHGTTLIDEPITSDATRSSRPASSDESNDTGDTNDSTHPTTPRLDDLSDRRVADTVLSQPTTVPRQCTSPYRVFTAVSEPLMLCTTEEGLRAQTDDTTILIVTLIDRRDDLTGGMLPQLYRYQRDHNRTTAVVVFELNATVKTETTPVRPAITLNRPTKLFIKNHILPYARERTITLPLTLLYRYGKLYAVYKGITPIEMIQSDIKRYMQEE